MPVSPALAESLAAGVAELYADAERLMLARIARSLGQGLDAPDWAARKLLEIQFLQAQTRRLITALERKAAVEVAVALSEAYNRGSASAAVDLAALVGESLETVVQPLGGLPPVERLVTETLGYVTATSPRILRVVEDVYREVVSRAAAQVLLGTQTRRQAAQEALNEFASKGVTGFVDKAGRGWRLESYVEMAMRTGTAKAAVAGHTDRLQEAGQDLVIVSDSPRECDLCRPFEGKVLSISGRDPNHLSVDEARAAGLFHPSCTHSVGLYIEGVTRPMKGTANPEGYEAKEKQRYLERKVRESKRIEAAALDPAAKKAAQAKVRAYQKKLRDHVAENDLKRLPYREQIGKAI